MSGNGTSPSYSWQFELTAISAVDGTAMWKLPIPGGRVSRPVLGSDRLIYLTVDNYQMFYDNFRSGGSMMTPDQAQVSDGQLLVISPTKGSAAIQRTIQASSDVLSAPRIAADGAGSYLICVLGYDMMSWTSTPGSPATTFAPGEKTLNAYRPDGSLKFSVKLSQTTNGMSRP
jgi:outer membrane protein assembly factor BamB